MATTKLNIYNDALLLCEERRLSSLTENRESRHVLDQVYSNDGILYCLAQGQWKFAMRATKLEAEPNFTPDWGFRYAFSKDTDWVVTSAVCSDEYFTTPLLRYMDEVEYWWADIDTIYVRYVSSGIDFGLDFGKWPVTFHDYVAAHFAMRICAKLSGGDRELMLRVKAEYDDRRLTAKNRDAMGDPTRYPAPSAWNRARWGRGWRGGPMGDGGTTGQLTG